MNCRLRREALGFEELGPSVSPIEAKGISVAWIRRDLCHARGKQRDSGRAALIDRPRLGINDAMRPVAAAELRRRRR